MKTTKIFLVITAILLFLGACGERTDENELLGMCDPTKNLGLSDGTSFEMKSSGGTINIAAENPVWVFDDFGTSSNLWINGVGVDMYVIPSINIERGYFNGYSNAVTQISGSWFNLCFNSTNISATLDTNKTGENRSIRFDIVKGNCRAPIIINQLP